MASLGSECTADSAGSVPGAHASLALGVGSGALGSSMYPPASLLLITRLSVLLPTNCQLGHLCYTLE